MGKGSTAAVCSLALAGLLVEGDAALGSRGLFGTRQLCSNFIEQLWEAKIKNNFYLVL